MAGQGRGAGKAEEKRAQNPLLIPMTDEAKRARPGTKLLTIVDVTGCCASSQSHDIVVFDGLAFRAICLVTILLTAGASVLAAVIGRNYPHDSVAAQVAASVSPQSLYDPVWEATFSVSLYDRKSASNWTKVAVPRCSLTLVYGPRWSYNRPDDRCTKASYTVMDCPPGFEKLTTRSYDMTISHDGKEIGTGVNFRNLARMAAIDRDCRAAPLCF